ncbi:MAG TPA: hypothetical protein VGL65_00275 [Gemmatimonadales bacterium]|jgi:hypothetical protein
MLIVVAVLFTFQQPPAQLFPPVEHPGADKVDVAHRIAQVCGNAGTASRDVLLRREGALGRAAAAGRGSADGWTSLGCARAQLFFNGAIAHDGPLMIAGDSWADGAEHAFVEALHDSPGDVRAASGLAVLATNDAAPSRMKPVAAALLGAAARGVDHPAVLRACAELGLRTGDTAQARACAVRGLAAGHDSTWFLLRLARVAFRGVDTVDGNRDFILAAGASHDAATRSELDWHLQWFLSPAERSAWDALPDHDRANWVRDRLASRDVRDGQPAGTRLAEHFARLEYVESHFQMSVARVLHDAMRTMPAEIQLPALDTMQQRGDTTIFREYQRWQVDFDDRGVVWMRWGKPSKVTFDTVSTSNMLAREAWRYDLDGQTLLVTFQGENFSGSSGATSLQVGMIEDFLCDVDSWRCALAMKKDGGFLHPEDVSHVIEQDREYISAATTGDDNSPRGDKPIAVVSRLNRLWDPLTGIPEALVTYAVKASDLAVQDSPSGRTTLLDFDLRTWDAGADGWTDTVFSRHLRLPDTTMKQLNLTGFLLTPASPGISSWSLVATQPDHRRGRVWDVLTPALDGGSVALSDLVMGQEGQGIVWSNHNVEIPLAPLNAVDRTHPAALYFQVRKDGGPRSVRATVALYRTTAPQVTAADSAVLQVSFDQAIHDGINEVAPSLDLSQLARGAYLLEVRLADANGVIITRRSVPLRLD